MASLGSAQGPVLTQEPKNMIADNQSTDGDLKDSEIEAINLFEQAMEKETHGSMSDAVELYRRAFRIDEKVDILYRKVKVPHKVQQLKAEGGKNSSVRVDEAIVSSLDVDSLLQSYRDVDALSPWQAKQEEEMVDSLAAKLANTSLEKQIPGLKKDVSVLIKLPHDIWGYILEILLLTSPESWFNFSITCKKNAYLGFGSSNIWRSLCYLIYPLQVSYENLTFIEHHRQLNSDQELPVPKDQLSIVSQYDNSWKRMLRSRPFIKFLGCYISVVNYYNEGGGKEFTISYSKPVKSITYYRYIRFYPDGTCVKVLTPLEPNRIVPQLLKYNTERSINAFAENAKMDNHTVPKDNFVIYHGTWSISASGEVFIRINEGSVPYYYFHYHFQVQSIGKVYRHAKLNWVKNFVIRKKTYDGDEREGELSTLPLKNEKPFKFLRVRSYKIDN